MDTLQNKIDLGQRKTPAWTRSHSVRIRLQRILEQAPVPVVPMALRGLWGSFFSRSHQGKAMRRWRGMFSRIALVAGTPFSPELATPEALQKSVLGLRGDWR